MAVNHEKDAQGDEGAIFQKLLSGETLGAQELSILNAEKVLSF